MKDFMLIDKDQVDFSGLVCDKIGADYSAFRTQSRACSRPKNAFVSVSGFLGFLVFLVPSGEEIKMLLSLQVPDQPTQGLLDFGQ
jgi:hypothetical protein